MNFFDEIDNFEEGLITLYPGVGTSSSSNNQPCLKNCPRAKPSHPPVWGFGGFPGFSCGLFAFKNYNDVKLSGSLGNNSKLFVEVILYDQSTLSNTCHAQNYEIKINNLTSTNYMVHRSTNEWAHNRGWTAIWTIFAEVDHEIFETLFCPPSGRIDITLEIYDSYWMGEKYFSWTLPHLGDGKGCCGLWWTPPCSSSSSSSVVPPSTKKTQNINFNNQNQSYLL